MAARRENGGVYRLCTDALNDGGECVFGDSGDITYIDRRIDKNTRSIFWRHGVIDSGECGVTYDEADRIAGSDAALRRVYEVKKCESY